MGRDILIVGLSHRTAPVAVRERLGFSPADLPAALARLTQLEGVHEAAIVSTCNRVEVVACVDEEARGLDTKITEFLGAERNIARDEFASHLYVHCGRKGVRHLFRVAASLDSMVVGEPQILGQVKEHYEEAALAGTSGSVLHRVFHRAFAVAKRVRTETAIAGKAVSIASVAVDLARTIFESFADKTAMLIGAGTMSEIAARHLKTHGIASIVVATRTFERAVALAREFDGIPVPFDRVAEYLKLADVVIGSASASEYLVTPALVQEVLRARKQRPMFFIDLAVPRNFDPAINALDNVYLYDIDDLGVAVAGNVEEREREAVRAEAIVEEEVERYWRWFASLEVVPTIVAIRTKVEAIRQHELEKALATLKDQAPRHRELLDALTSSIVNKILHAPISSLKRQDEHGEELDLIASARRLFDLELPPSPPDDEESS
ncbi:MAG: glutamyl-tRNA reductase [Deltaproteobacteria bacterium]|nr:glutamyl-tRNA reductase [Deltaproteobacteria bacterium]